MRFFAAVALFGAAAVASETVQIKDATFRANQDGPQAASFTIQPANVECSSTSAAELASDVAVTCGESNFRFELGNGGNGEYKLTIHKQTAPGTGLSGSKEFGVQGHAGGNGQDDYVLSPKGDVEVTLN